MNDLLNKIADELETHFEAKEQELTNNSNFNSHIQGRLNISKQQVQRFKERIKEIENDYSQQKRIVNDFRVTAEEIKLEIDKITCEV